ncbi:MAG: MarR family transcriptional regulator [Desulfovibrionaceae bacterium]|nr:MarR family transcriptional regulator [Desulfovibrionaceae bacterium]
MEITNCRWFGLANRYYNLYLSQRLACLGLNVGQHLIVLAVCREPGITQDRLPAQLGLNKSNVARGLATLEEKGFVERRINENDKRTAHIWPTEKGRETYPLIMDIVRDWDSNVIAIFSDEENAKLKRQLQQIAEAAMRFVKGNGD